MPNFVLDLRSNSDLSSHLRGDRIERAIGVIYRPDTELISHYFHARLSDQFDAVLHYDHTRAVEPLERTTEWEMGEVEETFPSGFVSARRWRRCTTASITLILVLATSLLRASYPKAEGRNQISKNATTAGPFVEIVRGPRGKSEIALTFDAGAEAECFEDLIAALESAKVHSTFFVTGNLAQKNRGCAAAITKHGHEVGNHTWNHPNLTQQPDAVVREEISNAEVILNELTGHSPRPLWRAPYGGEMIESCASPAT